MRSTGRLSVYACALMLLAFHPRLAGQNAPEVNVLHSFTGAGRDGGHPGARLVKGLDGNFYGTTVAGSRRHDTVYKITPAGALTALHTFTGRGLDGADPCSDLIIGRHGSFIGTTRYGGRGEQGTVYQITSKGVFMTLHRFTGRGMDGAFPYSDLFRGSDGNLYGMTWAGGSRGCGTVFKITAAGALVTIRSLAVSGGDGGFPYAVLVQGRDGNFYGTTMYGGVKGDGTVFRVTPAGVRTILHHFTGIGADGAEPCAGLAAGSDGNFYGTTRSGGSMGRGTVFQITQAGVLKTLHSFTGIGNDGADPEASLAQDNDGNFYGTTWSGGSRGHGTVFRISRKD